MEFQVMDLTNSSRSRLIRSSTQRKSGSGGGSSAIRATPVLAPTVRNHASNIYAKLHVFDRTQAVLYAIRKGLVDLEDLNPGPP